MSIAKEKIKKKSENANMKLAIVALGIFIFLVILSTVLGTADISDKTEKINKMNEIVKQQFLGNLKYKEWMVENCKCVEWNGARSCIPGYELINNVCKKGNFVTNVLISCSKFKCPYGLVKVN